MEKIEKENLIKQLDHLSVGLNDLSIQISQLIEYMTSKKSNINLDEIRYDLELNIKVMSDFNKYMELIDKKIILDRLKDAKELLKDISNNRKDPNFVGDIKDKSELLESLTLVFIKKAELYLISR